MKIALEINDDRYEVDSHLLIDGLELILKEAGYLDSGDSLDVLTSDERYILDKSII